MAGLLRRVDGGFLRLLMMLLLWGDDVDVKEVEGAEQCGNAQITFQLAAFNVDRIY